jgi:hypothetical protein
LKFWSSSWRRAGELVNTLDSQKASFDASPVAVARQVVFIYFHR